MLASFDQLDSPTQAQRITLTGGPQSLMSTLQSLRSVKCSSQFLSAASGNSASGTAFIRSNISR